MRIKFRKTKSAVVLIVISSLLMQVDEVSAISLFMLATALGLYGLYDRGVKRGVEASEKMEEIKNKIKKPRMVS